MLEVFDVPEVMRCVLLLAGGAGDVGGDVGGDVLCATLFAGGVVGSALCANLYARGYGGFEISIVAVSRYDALILPCDLLRPRLGIQ